MLKELIVTTAFAFASLLSSLGCTQMSIVGADKAPSIPTVGKHKTLELVFAGSSVPVRPFETYLLKVEVTDPEGKTLHVEGFYDGDGKGGQTGQIWKVRLCPYKTGTWRWRTVAADAADRNLEGLSGNFTCVESGDLGGLIARGSHFSLQDGGYFYPVGHFLDVAGQLPLWSYLGEGTTDAQRNAIMIRHRKFHTVNKYMFYLSNRSDASWQYKEYVTPWIGDHTSSDKEHLDLARWRLYDEYLRQMKDCGMSAYMSIFEDGKPGNYGDLPESDRNRLLRYAMARTSAYSHLWYVLCFEWQEAWTRDEVNRAGRYLQAHNPWKRLVSVHDWAFEPWAFSDQPWTTYIPAQCGNEQKDLGRLHDYVASLRSHPIPVLADEFGYDATDLLRSKMWVAFCSGAAGVGTGHDLKPFQTFLSRSRIPFQRMSPSDVSVEGGSSTRFCLAEARHHYLVYSSSGAFKLTVRGSGLKGHWFNPRDVSATLGEPFDIEAGSSTFTPPELRNDWVLWVTDGSNLNSGVTQLSAGAAVVQVYTGK